MSLFRSLVRAALRCLDEGGQPERGQGSGPLLLPPPRSELGFPRATNVYGQLIERSTYEMQPPRYAPPPVAWQPPAPPAPRRRRRKTVTVIEEVFYRRG